MLKNAYKRIFKLICNNKQYLGLILIQGGNAFFPVLLFPILLSKLGPEKFSEIVFSESVMMMLFTLIVYSFDITGIKAVKDSLVTGGRDRVYYNILTLRVFICVFLIFTLFCLFKIFDSKVFFLVIIWMLYPIGYAFQSNYFFLAVNKNHILGAIVFITRIVSSIFIIVYVDEKTEIEIVIFLLSFSFFLSGLISYIYCALFEVKVINVISFRDAKVALLDGVSIFLSNLSVGLFRGSNVIILGMFSSSHALAVYSIAEKLIKTTQALMTPLNQLGLAKFSALYICQSQLRSILWDCTKIQLKVGCLLILIFNTCFAIFVSIDTELNFEGAFFIYLIMSPAIAFGLMNFMYGMVGLNIAGFKKEFAYMVFIIGVCSVMVSIFIVKYMHQYGAAISFLVSEFVLFLLIYRKVSKLT